MVYLQIRDVSEEVRDVLAEQAREKGQSLNMYLRDVVTREASFAKNRALLAELSTWTTGTGATADDVLAALGEARTERENHLLAVLDPAYPKQQSTL